MNKDQMHSALRRIGLVLNASHNLRVTDIHDGLTDEINWITDHSQEIKDLKNIEKFFGIIEIDDNLRKD